MQLSTNGMKVFTSTSGPMGLAAEVTGWLDHMREDEKTLVVVQGTDTKREFVKDGHGEHEWIMYLWYAEAQMVDITEQMGEVPEGFAS